jgi:hypothetical protein
MRAEIIVALIAATISIITLLIAKIVEILENRKNRYASIITMQTLSNMLFMRENFSTILTNTNPTLLTRTENGDYQELKNQLVHACTNIEMQFKSVLSIEVDMIDVMRELICHFFSYIDAGDKEDKDLIITKHRKLAELIEVYDYADWLYCKDQAWYRKKTRINFEQIYNQQKLLFEKAKKPKSWEACNLESVTDKNKVDL